MSVALAELSEKEWTAQIVGLARTLGYKRYHTYRSRHSEAGWPDEALVRERLILAELKREGGKVSSSQREWLNLLAGAGQEVYVWYPRDLEEIGAILGARWLFDMGACVLRRYNAALRPLPVFSPGSAWLAGHGRRDS